jgi:PAS domain S-box-containing protein
MNVVKDKIISNDLQQQFDDLQKYRALVATSNIGAWEYFPGSGFMDCNSVYFSMLGRDINNYKFSEKNLNETWIDLLHPDDEEAAISRFMGYLKKPVGMYESFYRMKHADGSWVWICSRGGFLKDAKDTNINTMIGTHVDITRQKQAEEDIQRERILLRTLIDNLPDTIYVKDSEGRKIIANKADVATIGATAESEVIGKTDLELFPNEIGQRGYRNDMEVLHTGKALLNIEEAFYDKKGEKHWLLTSKVPVYDASGKINRILGIGHNITERKHSEEALNTLNRELNAQSVELSKQASKLKALNDQLIQQKEQELEKAIAQGKFEIASEVLHDIGNALVGFGSYLTRINRVTEKNNLDAVKNLNLFLKGQQTLIGNAIGTDKANALVTITEGIAKTQTDNQKEVNASIKELLNIVSHIQEILNIQRQFVRSHGGSYERKPVNIANIIDDCRSMLLASLDKKGVKLNVNIKQGNHIVKGDHTKLMQVILNILKNSLEAIDIEEDEKIISVILESADEFVSLKIVDNGQGFDKETSSRFFERGFTTKKSGTGLGLYNCKSIVESHAGSLEISSEGPGLGAVTIIKFAV